MSARIQFVGFALLSSAVDVKILAAPPTRGAGGRGARKSGGAAQTRPRSFPFVNPPTPKVSIKCKKRSSNRAWECLVSA